METAMDIRVYFEIQERRIRRGVSAEQRIARQRFKAARGERGDGKYSTTARYAIHTPYRDGITSGYRRLKMLYV